VHDIQSVDTCVMKQVHYTDAAAGTSNDRG